MNRDPGEGTSGGQIKRKRKSTRKMDSIGPEQTIKEEIKEDPMEFSELDEYSRRRQSSTINAIDMIQSDSDDQSNYESEIDYYVKDEIKSECEEKEGISSESNAKQNGLSNGIDGGNSDGGNQNNPQPGTSGNGKGCKLNPNVKGRKRVLTKKRDMVNAAKKPQTGQKKTHTCQQCNYSASKKSNLTQHIRTHTGEKPFECEICQKSFALKSNLNCHKRTHRSEFAFHCSKCQSGLANETEKEKHELKCRHRQYKCYLCEYSPRHLAHLKIHMRYKHTGEKRFECSVCSKKYATKDHLNGHSRVHGKQLPFACLKCGRRFASQNEAESHEKHCKCRKFECFLCHKYKSFYKGHLKLHMRIHHTGEKPFRCPVCQKQFVHNGNLKRHLKTNCKSRMIHCSKCLRRFAKEDDKTTHEERCNRRHYECHLCKVKYQHLLDLKYHMKKHHFE